MRYGKGVMLYKKDGDKVEKYEGEWYNDKENGKGQYTWIDGSKFKGTYDNGMRTGKGEYTEVNGNNFIGEYVNDERSG